MILTPLESGETTRREISSGRIAPLFIGTGILISPTLQRGKLRHREVR